jgi:hypothetical protein
MACMWCFQVTGVNSAIASRLCVFAQHVFPFVPEFLLEPMFEALSMQKERP